MLVLSRKLDETILIGPDIKITVVQIDRGKVRLGIECPKHIPVYRQELAPFTKELPHEPERTAD